MQARALLSATLALGAALAITTIAVAKDPARQLTDRAGLLKSIAAGCHVPRRYLKLDSSGAVHFRPPANTPIKPVDCVSGELLRNHLGPIGIIGNEQYRPNPK